jgi:hypothetical protein
MMLEYMMSSLHAEAAIAGFKAAAIGTVASGIPTVSVHLAIYMIDLSQHVN